MSKGLIIQISITNEECKLIKSYKPQPIIYEHSNSNIRDYAKRIGVDYHLITDDRYFPGEFVAFSKIAVIHEDFKEYDTICFIASDMFTHDMTPNIFDIVNKSDKEFFAVIESFENHKNDRWESYFNADFFIIKRPFIERYRDTITSYFNDSVKNKNKQFEQSALNFFIRDHYPNYGILSKHWNGVMAMKSPLFMTHYSSNFNKLRYFNKPWLFDRHIKFKKNELKKLTPEQIDYLHFYDPSDPYGYNHNMKNRSSITKGKWAKRNGYIHPEINKELGTT